MFFVSPEDICKTAKQEWVVQEVTNLFVRQFETRHKAAREMVPHDDTAIL